MFAEQLRGRQLTGRVDLTASEVSVKERIREKNWAGEKVTARSYLGIFYVSPPAGEPRRWEKTVGTGRHRAVGFLAQYSGDLLEMKRKDCI